MIPIKILCDCGQKYTFDVEPVGGGMGYAVQCPTCGIDGTTTANLMIAQQMGDTVAPAAGLRLGGQKLTPTAPPPPRQIAPAPPASFHARKAEKKWLLPAISTAAVVVLLGAGAVFNHVQKHEGAKTVVFANDGLPHTLEELNSWYVEPPPGQNAATFYSQGFDALKLAGAANLDKGKLPALGASLPGPMKSALAALMTSNRDALQSFEQGAKQGQSRYPVDLTQGFEATLPHLAKLKSATQLTELSAMWHADGHDGKQAAHDVLMTLALGRSLESEPLLISQLMRAATVSTAVTALEQAINRASLPRESLSELLAAFQKMEDDEARGEGFNRALAGERAISMSLLGSREKMLQALPALASGAGISGTERNQIVAQVQKTDNLKAEQDYYEKCFQQLMAARKEPFPDRLKTESLIRQCATEATSQKLVVNGLLQSGLAGYVPREARALAHFRLGLTAVALEQFRLAHENRYPAALSELAPDYAAKTPVDPFDGQPLRYRKKGAGYLLYSVGSDLKDDSGERAKDIVFAVISSAKPAE